MQCFIMLKGNHKVKNLEKKPQHQNEPQKNHTGKHLKELFATIPYNIVVCPVPLQARAE